MRLEQWSNIRNNVKQVKNELAKELDHMEASGKSYDEIISNYSRYNEAVVLWINLDLVVNHMDEKLTVQEIEKIDYWQATLDVDNTSKIFESERIC